MRIARDARYRAKRDGQPEPEIAAEILEQWLRAGRCAVTGVPFVLADPVGGRPHPLAPSLDRIDKRKPYTIANSRLVVWGLVVLRRYLGDDQTRSRVLRTLYETYYEKGSPT